MKEVGFFFASIVMGIMAGFCFGFVISRDMTTADICKTECEKREAIFVRHEVGKGCLCIKGYEGYE